MAQQKNPLDEVRIPFAKMTFAPDVPSTALGPNEYNAGINVETDVRGIRSTAGDQAILSTVPGTPTFITGGFRINETEFWFIVATDEGYWWASNGEDDYWHNINPDPDVPFAGYNQALNITEAWNGTIPIFNDTLNPPMFLPDGVDARLIPYSNTLPIEIYDITYDSPTTQVIWMNTVQTQAPYAAGDRIQIQGAGEKFDGIFTVVSSDTEYIYYLASGGGAYPTLDPLATVAPQYSWNTNATWKSYTAGFMRMYSTPNVGSILVAGNLTAVEQDDSTTNYAVTVQWSQAFGLNQAPLSWAASVTNVANQLEVPLRGPALDGFPCNGQFFLCSYWDTVVFSPINYSTTSAPILGVRLFNQGRGLLSSNCWANTDKLVYGVDARDIWVFDGQDFQGLGNQRVKNWFYNQLDPQYYDRVFMEVNSQRNQVEIYYPNQDAIDGVPNRMISYRYDIDCWNAPREIAEATFACESPIWLPVEDSSLPNWSKNLASRTVVYARGVQDSQIIQKDQGFAWYDDTAISSQFRRDNIKMLPNYSGKVMVHRILPEAVNIGAYPDSADDELPLYPSTGNINVKIEGANSVGSEPANTVAKTMAINTTDPWVQINQNAYRVNTIELSNTSNSDIWMCSATTWQYTQVEDDR